MLILASASPRRSELLAQIGESFRVEHPGISELRLAVEAPSAYVRRLALEKAQSVWERLRAEMDQPPLPRSSHESASKRPQPSGGEHPQEPLIVLGADTAVVCDQEVLGKPLDADDAARMLRLLSGRSHQVLTGVAVVTHTGAVSEVETTEVVFAPITDGEMAAYIATGEPFDKAGAYGIQGRAARWIPRIEGCYFNVVGLPLARVAALLAAARLGLS